MACRTKGVQLENVHLRLKHSNLDIVINHQCQWITKKVCTCHTSNVMMASTTSVVHDQIPRVEVISMNKQSFSNPHTWFWSHKRRHPTSHPHNGLMECLLLWSFGRRLTVNIGQHYTNFYHMYQVTAETDEKTTALPDVHILVEWLNIHPLPGDYSITTAF